MGIIDQNHSIAVGIFLAVTNTTKYFNCMKIFTISGNEFGRSMKWV